MQNISFQYICILILVISFRSTCQIFRDITLEYLHLDKNEDNILSPQEQEQYVGQEPENNKYHNLETFQNELYSKVFWKPYDLNLNSKVEIDELAEIINEKWSKYHSQVEDDQNNELDLLTPEDYMEICDSNGDNVLEASEFPACLHGILTFEASRFKYPFESAFYRNKSVGYDFEEFKKLMPRFKGTAEEVEEILVGMFNKYEWDNDKIVSDNDDMIGPAEGQFLEPFLVMKILDRNKDGVLIFEEANTFLRRFGGIEIFEMVDENLNGQISKEEFISYYVFASCIECPWKNNSEKAQNNSKESQEQSSKEEL